MLGRRLAGIAMLIAAFGVLVFTPDKLGFLFAGLALAVSGVPFLLGLVGTPKAVVQARQCPRMTPASRSSHGRPASSSNWVRLRPEPVRSGGVRNSGWKRSWAAVWML